MLKSGRNGTPYAVNWPTILKSWRELEKFTKHGIGVALRLQTDLVALLLHPVTRNRVSWWMVTVLETMVGLESVLSPALVGDYSIDGRSVFFFF